MLKNIKKVAKAKITSWDPKINRKPNMVLILSFRSVLGSQDLIFALTTFYVFQHEVESRQIRTIVLADLIARSPELGEREMRRPVSDKLN